MRGGEKKTWRWRVADQEANKRLNLLYEPGNWGDILKGLWAVLAARALARLRPGARMSYLDPFAGAPTYPLVEASRRRFEAIPPSLFLELQKPYAARGQMASTALLVRDAWASEGAKCLLRVFDADPERIEAWRQTSDVEVVAGPCGEAILETVAQDPAHRPDFLLVDPYDFFVRWKELLPKAAQAAQGSTVLLYLYNKAPRGPGQQRLYADFRASLSTELREARARALLGRVPADATVARAYHEVVLLGTAAQISELEEELAAHTRALASAVVESGAFEVIRWSQEE